MRASIQCPKNASTTIITMSLGTNVSELSCTCVAAWKMLTITPVTRAAPMIGPPSERITIAASRPSERTVSGVMRLPVARHQRAHHEVPAVREDEEEQLERQRDHDGGQHHHAHRHEDARD